MKDVQECTYVLRHTGTQYQIFHHFLSYSNLAHRIVWYDIISYYIIWSDIVLHQSATHRRATPLWIQCSGLWTSVGRVIQRIRCLSVLSGYLYILHMTGCTFVRRICQYSTFLGVAGRHSNYDNTHDCKNYSHMSHCLAIICTLTSVEYSTVRYSAQDQAHIPINS